MLTLQTNLACLIKLLCEIVGKALFLKKIRTYEFISFSGNLSKIHLLIIDLFIMFN